MARRQRVSPITRRSGSRRIASRRDQSNLKKRFDTWAAGNVPSCRRPEFLQLCGFVTGLVTFVELDLNCLNLILLRERHPGIDVRRHLVSVSGHWDCCVEVQSALL